MKDLWGEEQVWRTQVTTPPRPQGPVWATLSAFLPRPAISAGAQTARRQWRSVPGALPGDSSSLCSDCLLFQAVEAGAVAEGDSHRPLDICIAGPPARTHWPALFPAAAAAAGARAGARGAARWPRLGAGGRARQRGQGAQGREAAGGGEISG